MHQYSVNDDSTISSNGMLNGLRFDKLSNGIFSAVDTSSTNSDIGSLEAAFANLSLGENPKIKAYYKTYDDQVIKEEKRCQDALRLFESTVQVPETMEREECVVCLTELPPDIHHYVPRTDVAKQFLCCGKHICVACMDKTLELDSNPAHPFEMRACMHCRSPATATLPLTRHLAVQGQAWAQARMAFYYDAGTAGVSRNMKQALGWYTKAADQGFTRAQVELGLCYMTGRGGVKENDTKALKYLERAACKGDPKALYTVVMIYVCGHHNGTAKQRRGKEMADLVLLLTVAATKGNADAQLMLGLAYHKYWGDSSGMFGELTPSLERAEYWLTKAVKQDGREPPKALDEGHLELVHVLIDRANKHLKSPFIAGHCPLPRVYYHAVEAVELEQERGKCIFAAKFLAMSDAGLKQHCAFCHCRDKKLTKCSQCKVFYYCGKKCQVKHWKAGHCNDCVKTHYNNKKKVGKW